MSPLSEPSPEPLQSILKLLIFTDNYGIIILFLVFLLFFFAFLTGIQFIFFPSNKLKQTSNHISQENTEKEIKNALKSSKKVFFALVAVKNFIIVTFVILSYYLFLQLLLNMGFNSILTIVSTVGIITLCLIVFGELYPQRWTKKNKDLSIHIGILFMRFLHSTTHFFNKKAILSEKHKNTSNLTEVSFSFSRSVSSSNEQNLLEGILKFGNTETKHVMCPRIEVIAVDKKSSLNEIVEIVTKTGYSRLPVYQNTFDEVVGIVYAKDLFPYLSQKKDFAWQEIIRKPLFVPENKKINELLKEFQSRKMHFAIVVDEYGGTAGIVTLEDIIEEIVGEIVDEYDEEEKLYTKIDSTTYLFDARIDLDEFYQIMKVDSSKLPPLHNDSETLGGFLSQLLGQIPNPKQIIKLDKFQFVVEESDKKRIKLLKVIQL